jgi:hypothetical protein
VLVLLVAPLLVVALLVAPLVVQVGLLVALVEVLVPLLGESVVLGLVIAVVMAAVGLVENLSKGFLQEGQILSFQRVQVQPAKQQADLELLVQGQHLQPGCFHLLAQFDDLRCQLANLELLLLCQLSRMEQFLYDLVLWMSW